MSRIKQSIHPDDQAHYDKMGLRKGAATIEKLKNGSVTESVTEPSAVWELMYFGKAGADKGSK